MRVTVVARFSFGFFIILNIIRKTRYTFGRIANRYPSVATFKRYTGVRYILFFQTFYYFERYYYYYYYTENRIFFFGKK